MPAPDAPCDVEFIGPGLRVLRSSALNGPIAVIMAAYSHTGRTLVVGSSDDIVSLLSVTTTRIPDADYHYTDAPNRVN